MSAGLRPDPLDQIVPPQQQSDGRTSAAFLRGKYLPQGVCETARLTLTALQPVPTDTWTGVLFNHGHFDSWLDDTDDNERMVDVPNHQIVIRSPGIYKVISNVVWDARFYLPSQSEIQVNGATIAKTTASTDVTVVQTNTVEIIRRFERDDVITVRVYRVNDGGTPSTNILPDDESTFLAVYWVANAVSNDIVSRPPPSIAIPQARSIDGESIVVLADPTGSWPDSVGDGETWMWTEGVWLRILTANSPPSRSRGVMCLDETNGKIVLFGGISGDTGILNDTWTFDGSDWTQESPATSPSARQGMGMAYDAASGYVVLYGGYQGATKYHETWKWTGTNWVDLAPANNPNKAIGPMLAYDGTQLICFGGQDGGAATQNTWKWTGTDWTGLTPSTCPPACQGWAAATIRAASLVSLSGGGCLLLIYRHSASPLPSDVETWSWDGSDWTQLTPTDSPVDHIDVMLGSDNAGRAMAYGSNAADIGDADDTVWWDGSNWITDF